MSAQPIFRPLSTCRRCLDRGFVNAREIPDVTNRPGVMLGKAVMEKGVACDCAYGAKFAALQMEWMKLIPEGKL